MTRRHPRPLRMILEYEGYECSGPRRPGGHRAGRARSARPRLPRHQDARHGRPRGAATASRRSETLPVVMISGHATSDRGRGHQARRVRLPREAARRASACCSRSATRSTARGCATRTASLQAAVEVRHQMVGKRRRSRRCMDADRARGADQRHGADPGESGVGKELVARAIHRNSLRAASRSCR